MATLEQNNFMRKIAVSALFVLPWIFYSSCTNANNKTVENQKDTTVYDETRPIGNEFLETLLSIKSEAELKEKFGADRVKFDTIWGAEGNFGFGTYLDKGTKDEVQIMWADSLRTGGVMSAMAVAFYDQKTGNYIFDNRWSSEMGVKIGTTTDELEKLNGKPFVFSGFGWDYGGGIMDWKGGKLGIEGIGIALTEDLAVNEIPEKEYEQILGDQDVRSDHPVVKKVQPKVYRITVYNEN